MDLLHPCWSIVFRCTICNELCQDSDDHRGVVFWSDDELVWKAWCPACVKDISNVSNSEYSFYPEATYYFYTTMVIEKSDVQRLLDTRLITMDKLGKDMFVDLCIKSFQAKGTGRDL